MRIAFLLLCISAFCHAADPAADVVRPSKVPPWRCYTRIGEDGNSNTFVTVKGELEFDAVIGHLPVNIGDETEGKSPGKIRWLPLPDDTDSRIELLAVCSGKRLYMAEYTEKSERVDRDRVLLFLLETREGFVRPFFLLRPDETETVHHHFETSAGHPFVFTAHTSMSGTGGFYSLYRFAFPGGRPQFLYREDGGRHNEPTIVK